MLELEGCIESIGAFGLYARYLLRVLQVFSGWLKLSEHCAGYLEPALKCVALVEKLFLSIIMFNSSYTCRWQS